MKKLLILASASEFAFGLLLLLYPSLIARLLLATDISGAAVTVARIVGACLIALGVFCWPSGDSRRQFYIMLTWSVLAACSLIIVGIRWSAGVLLWPAVVVHGAVSVSLIWTNRQPKSAA